LGLEPPKPEVTALAAVTPDAPAPPDAANTRDLPDFAKKADDLEAIKQAVDDAASVGGGLWLSYLFVLFYLAVAAGAVTHARSLSRKSGQAAVPQCRTAAARLLFPGLLRSSAPRNDEGGKPSSRGGL
jgi:hypothetical protein